MGVKIVLGAERVDVQVESVLVDLERGHLFDLVKMLPLPDQHWVLIQLERYLAGVDPFGV